MLVSELEKKAERIIRKIKLEIKMVSEMLCK